MNRLIAILALLAIIMSSCASMDREARKSIISSPDGNITVTFWLDDGIPYYAAFFKGHEVIAKSLMGFVLEENDIISDHLVVKDQHYREINETWEQPWGQQRLVKSHCNEGEFILFENKDKKRNFTITFRVFNDGFGFRYSFPEQENLGRFTIMDELTEFALTADHQAWWIPAYKDNRYEYLYTRSALSTLDTVHTPLTMEANDGYVVSIHEAALVNYASMTLASKADNILKCDLTPWSDGTKVKAQTPLVTPWRTIQIADNAGDLILSTMILNLNEPNQLEDLSFVEPNKYLGIWWGMHIGKYTFWEGPEHGASTAHSKEYIDACNKLGIRHLLIEGWNTGWTPQWYENRMHVFSFTQSTPDFNFEEVILYAREHQVKIVGYHETGSNIENYLAQIDDGMGMYHHAGMESIKIGQVGSRLNMKEWHHGQFGVDYYQTVLKKAADYKLAVNFHEPIKPTGLSRTFPHLMSCEGGRGQEYNAWSEGNPPEHETTLPFTRLLGGPMDFTPGIFGIKGTNVHTTLAKQLALYLTIYSPIQMLADLPENYIGHPAYKFLLDVPVNWDTTVVLNARIGDYFTVARKDIASNDWYLGSITDENSRDFTIDLTFLDEDKTYIAQIYADGSGAEFGKNPESYAISEMEVTKNSQLNIRLAKGGGQAIRFAVKNIMAAE
jgi:alpha-glucosidase